MSILPHLVRTRLPRSAAQPAALLIAALLLLGAFAAALILYIDQDPAPSAGRIVDTGPASAFKALQPKAFPRDDFSLLKLDDGRFVALYSYPPGYSGHAQGCTIRWNPAPQLSTAFHERNLWVEGCSGSLWDPSGKRLYGPDPRDLDQFPVTVQAGRVRVDTRRLQCATSASFPQCERAGGPVTNVLITVTANGFQPSHVELPAGRPAYVILKNNTTVAQSWHVVGVPDAAGNARRWPPLPSNLLGADFPDGSDIHVVTPPGGQLGRPFTIAKRGTYTVVSDADPTHLRRTLVVH